MLPLPLCPGTTAAAGPEVGAGRPRRERIGLWFGLYFFGSLLTTFWVPICSYLNKTFYGCFCEASVLQGGLSWVWGISSWVYSQGISSTGMSCRWKHKQAKPCCPPNSQPRLGNPQPHTEPRGQGRDIFIHPIFPQASHASRACCSLPVCQPQRALPELSQGLLKQFKPKKNQKKRQNQALRWEMSSPGQRSEVGAVAVALWHHRRHILPVVAGGPSADIVLPSLPRAGAGPGAPGRVRPSSPCAGPGGVRVSPSPAPPATHTGTHLQPRRVGAALPTHSPTLPKKLRITPKA